MKTSTLETLPGDFGASATIGYQESNSSAHQFSFNTPSLSNGDVLDLLVPFAPDVDEYEVDLTGKAGEPIDVILAGDGVDLSGATLELLATNGTTVLATGVTDPVQAATDVTNYDQGILDFIVPSDGIYTVRLTSGQAGDYSIVISDPLSFDSEPNDSSTDPLA